jgi:hypothetical protein
VLSGIDQLARKESTVLTIFNMLLALALVPSMASAIKTLGSDSYRSTSGTFDAGISPYNYAPSVMAEGVYKMWWCGVPAGATLPGDHILYAESTSYDGPWHSQDGSSPWQAVFQGTGTGTFDSKHTCDPSVVKVGDTYYMYYGAEQDDGLPTTAGVASSPDGINWTRLNNGQPIFTQAGQLKTNSAYGAGQPSVTYVNGTFYMIFTDTTGAGANPQSGNGQFLWRSSDPTFQSNTEVWTTSGWQAKTEENSRSLSIINAVSTDWQYSDVLDAFVIAHQSPNNITTLSFFDPTDFSTLKYEDVAIPGVWTEGPGIISRSDKHSVVTATTDCGRVPMDVVRSTEGAPPTGLAHIGVDVILSGLTC